jgi:hypothetical protein
MPYLGAEIWGSAPKLSEMRWDVVNVDALAIGCATATNDGQWIFSRRRNERCIMQRRSKKRGHKRRVYDRPCGHGCVGGSYDLVETTIP